MMVMIVVLTEMTFVVISLGFRMLMVADRVGDMNPALTLKRNIP